MILSLVEEEVEENRSVIQKRNVSKWRHFGVAQNCLKVCKGFVLLQFDKCEKKSTGTVGRFVLHSHVVMCQSCFEIQVVILFLRYYPKKIPFGRAYRKIISSFCGGYGCTPGVPLVSFVLPEI